MPYRLHRFLMLWLLVALQATMPFVHAHAGAVRLNRANFLHLHQALQGDVPCHALTADEHGAEFEVVQGRPLRIDPLDAARDVPPAVALFLPRADQAALPGAGLPAPPERQRVPPAHTHPHALAPPAV